MGIGKTPVINCPQCKANEYKADQRPKLFKKTFIDGGIHWRMECQTPGCKWKTDFLNDAWLIRKGINKEDLPESGYTSKSTKKRHRQIASGLRAKPKPAKQKKSKTSPLLSEQKAHIDWFLDKTEPVLTKIGEMDFRGDLLRKKKLEKALHSAASFAARNNRLHLGTLEFFEKIGAEQGIWEVGSLQKEFDSISGILLGPGSKEQSFH